MKNTHICHLGLILATSLIAAIPLRAAVSVSLSDTAPVDGIFKFQDTPDGTAASNITAYKRDSGSTLDRSVGQGFSTADLVGDADLGALTFKIYNFDSAVQGLAFNLSIYEASAISTTPSGSTLISTQTGVLSEALVAGDYITFGLDTPIALTTNRYYSVVFSFAELTATDGSAKSLGFSTIGSGISNSVIGGRRWIGDDGSFSASASNGLVMYAQLAAVPEPANYAFVLGAFSIGCIALGRRSVRSTQHAA